jgi:glutathione synthase/RimK-type ligase-like ATP-grasp enzyme
MRPDTPELQTGTPPQIALLTEARYAASRADSEDWYFGNILHDDAILAAALGRQGFAAERVDWARPNEDWRRFRGALFRTTWDYVTRIEAFRAWLDRAARETSLLNSPELVDWNLDKHYLADLVRHGVPTVPCHFLPRNSRGPLAEAMEAAGWDEAVIKPCISATAYLTYRITKDTASAVERELAQHRVERDFILQPFLQDVMTGGEVAVVVVDGAVTHAVRKVPAPGDFRVQDDHGGTVHPHDPAPDEVAVALAAVAASGQIDATAGQDPLYARVDLVRDGAGVPRVMELELIEPELWIRVNPSVADRLAEGLRRRLESVPVGG